MTNIIAKYTQESKANTWRKEGTICDLEEVSKELKSRKTTIEFNEVEKAMRADL